VFWQLIKQRRRQIEPSHSTVGGDVVLRVCFGHVAQVVKEAFRSGQVAFAPHTVEAVEMGSLAYAVDVERWDFDALFHGLPL